AMVQVVINPLLRTAGGEEHYAFNSVLAQLIFGGASFLSPLVYSYIVLNLKDTGNRSLAIFRSVVPSNLPWISLYWLFAVISILMKIMDSRKVLIIFTVLALIFLSVALFGSAKISLIAFPWIGFFASVMYPIIFSLALNSVNEHHGSFSGIIVTGIIGGAIVPLIIGWLGDHLGLRHGMLFLC